jgi:hypothetical protein
MHNKPSIIFIVADDLGFADLGCYGGRSAVFGNVKNRRTCSERAVFI